MPPALIDDSEEGAVSHRAAFFIEARVATLCPACLQSRGHLPPGAQNILVRT